MTEESLKRKPANAMNPDARAFIRFLISRTLGIGLFILFCWLGPKYIIILNEKLAYLEVSNIRLYKRLFKFSIKTEYFK